MNTTGKNALSLPFLKVFFARYKVKRFRDWTLYMLPRDHCSLPTASVLGIKPLVALVRRLSDSHNVSRSLACSHVIVGKPSGPQGWDWFPFSYQFRTKFRQSFVSLSYPSRVTPFCKSPGSEGSVKLSLLIVQLLLCSSILPSLESAILSFHGGISFTLKANLLVRQIILNLFCFGYW